MNRLFSAKPLLAAAIAIGALATVSAAQARSDVVFSIGLNAAPYGYVQPAPVYAQPAPVYYEPTPVYYEPTPAYYQPAPVYYQSSPVYYTNYRTYRHHGWRDSDHDGVPNRFDRQPNNPYRH